MQLQRKCSQSAQSEELIFAPFPNFLRPVLGLVIIVLMALHRHVWGPFYAEDLLAPVVAAILAADWRRLRLTLPLKTLGLFLAAAWTTSLIHLATGSAADLYNPAVHSYLAILFLFFSTTDLDEKWIQWTGCALLAIILAGWLAQLAIPSLPLSYITENSQGTPLHFLYRRYQWLFENPNNLGSFMVLPVTMALWNWKASASSWQRWLRLALALACLLPLCHTFSKHAILTGAAILALTLPCPRLSCLAILAIGIACEITVLFITFPLSNHLPYINTARGGYTIHQEIYLKMVTRAPAPFCIGLPQQEIHRLYPKLAETHTIRDILARYNAEHLLDTFATFMDPHNEYLNLMSFYGLLGMAGMALFLASLARHHGTPMALFILALALACLWDDLLSKRWLWITMAMLCNCPRPQNDKKTTALP